MVSNSVRKHVIFMLLVILLIMTMIPGVSAYANEYNNVLWLRVNSKTNYFFSRYLINVYLDEDYLGLVENGFSSTWISIPINVGKHIIKLCNKDDEKVFGEAEVSITESSYVIIDCASKHDNIAIEKLDVTSRYDTGVEMSDLYLREYDQLVCRLKQSYDVMYLYEKKGGGRHVYHYVLFNTVESTYEEVEATRQSVSKKIKPASQGVYTTEDVEVGTTDKIDFYSERESGNGVARAFAGKGEAYIMQNFDKELFDYIKYAYPDIYSNYNGARKMIMMKNRDFYNKYIKDWGW